MKYIPRYYNGLWYVTTGSINVYSTGKNREACISRCRQLNKEVETVVRNPPKILKVLQPSEEPPRAEYLCSQCFKDISEHPINEHGLCMQCLQSYLNRQRRQGLK